MKPGSMMTVFTYRESDRGNEELLHATEYATEYAAEHASDAPVMLIRLPPCTKSTNGPGQENFDYGDYFIEPIGPAWWEMRSR